MIQLIQLSWQKAHSYFENMRKSRPNDQIVQQTCGLRKTSNFQP